MHSSAPNIAETEYQVRNMEKKSRLLPVEWHDDLIIQILLRLPVKSLLRFRCVSKSWLSLISDPQFAASHLELAAAPTHRLMLIHDSTLRASFVDLDAPLHDGDSCASSDPIKLDFRRPDPPIHIRIMGSCRGLLLLLFDFSDIYVWNPCTGVHKQLPLSPIAAIAKDIRGGFFFGFGYDPSKDDYLVVLGSNESSAAGGVTHFDFLSLRANSWKRIEGTRCPLIECCPDSDKPDEPGAGRHLNGAIHWLVFRHDDNVIFAFDLVERSFSDIPLPDDPEYDFDFEFWVLLNHGGKLSLCVRGINRTDIWVMGEYKVQSSWTKSIVMYDNPPCEYFYPICSTKSGYIYGLDDDEDLLKCNAEGERLECCSYPCKREAATTDWKSQLSHSDAAVYTESLLSLPGDSVTVGKQKMNDNNKQEELGCEIFSKCC